MVTGDNHSINKVEFHASYIGMKLEDARNIKIENSIIVGQKKGKRIGLWQSDNNLIKNTKIQKVRDDLYVEKSNHNIVKSNRIQQSRYGIHLMYSDKTVIENNISKENTTGTMIMGVKDTFIAGNQFINNNNVHAQGFLLYDAVKTKVMQNEIVNNRVGMYVEKASDNTIMNKIISNNFIGLQFKETRTNEFTQNEITGNVNESQATQSRENHIYKNYWDASLKIDIDDSGTSDIPYKADAYFLLLTQDIPDYQLFFQTPGMRILQNFIRIPDQSVLLDKEPHIIPKIVAQKGEKRGFQSNVWISSISMLLLGSTLFILGRNN
nr:putative ABC transporter binding protein NosD [Bacillus cereus]WLE91165.1 putative ABC transporter binding protein NosD [Bacillus cereus]